VLIPSHRLNHGCHPDTNLSYRNGNAFLYATRRIKADEPILLDYIADASHVFTTEERRESLMRWNFRCLYEQCESGSGDDIRRKLARLQSVKGYEEDLVSAKRECRYLETMGYADVRLMNA